MSNSFRSDPPGKHTATDRQLYRWGGVAGLAGVISMVGAFVVVVVLGLPDASDVETLQDFENIEAGRNAEHFLYLVALVLFALHAFTLRRLLEAAHLAATLFATVITSFGLVIMAASSLLHVSTSPLSDLYADADASAADRQAIEYAWHGAQSVFDTMLTTGVFLVPIGIVLFGVAMRDASIMGPRLAWITIGLGAGGVIGATIAVVVPGSAFSAGSVLAIAAFNIGSGWRMLEIGRANGDLTAEPDTPDSTRVAPATGARGGAR